MDTFPGLQVFYAIRKINPWFTSGKVPSEQLQDFKRREFERLRATLNNTEMATLVLGGRRVGKSVLMYQLIDSLLSSGIDKKNILFIQGDNPILQEIERQEGESILQHIFTLYQEIILEKEFGHVDNAIYIFIDEAQNIKNWETQVKSLIDLKYNIKFIITGSSSVELRRGAHNPLTGRAMVEMIQPFSFADFAAYFIPEKDQEKFRGRVSTLSQIFAGALGSGSLVRAQEALVAANKIIDQFRLKDKFNDYLVFGGFPYVISQKTNISLDEARRYLRDLMTTTISRDILAKVGIRETLAFERLMVNFCLNIGSKIKYKSLADRLGIDERSVSKYVDHYAESHWAFVSSPYEYHRKADSVKTEKKIYVIDTGIINALAFKDRGDIVSGKDKSFRGQLVENVLHNHLLDSKQSSTGAYQNYIPFWTDGSTQKEIDFIHEVNGSIVPIESKCKEKLDLDDLEPMEKFLKDHKTAKFGIITVDNGMSVEGNVLVVSYIALTLLF